MEDANQAANFFGQTLEGAFEGLITGGESVTDVLGDMTKAILNAALQAELLGSGPLNGVLGANATASGLAHAFAAAGAAP